MAGDLEKRNWCVIYNLKKCVEKLLRLTCTLAMRRCHVACERPRDHVAVNAYDHQHRALICWSLDSRNLNLSKRSGLFLSVSLHDGISVAMGWKEPISFKYTSNVASLVTGCFVQYWQLFETRPAFLPLTTCGAQGQMWLQTFFFSRLSLFLWRRSPAARLTIANLDYFCSSRALLETDDLQSFVFFWRQTPIRVTFIYFVNVNRIKCYVVYNCATVAAVCSRIGAKWDPIRNCIRNVPAFDFLRLKSAWKVFVLELLLYLWVNLLALKKRESRRPSSQQNGFMRRCEHALSICCYV